MKKANSNTPDERSKKNSPKEATKKLFERRIEEFDPAKQELLRKLYSKIIEDKK
jgi:hypothetical protein